MTRYLYRYCRLVIILAVTASIVLCLGNLYWNHSLHNENDSIVILFWTNFFTAPFPLHYLNSCPALKSQCRLVRDKAWVSDAAAVIFHNTDIIANPKFLPNPRYRKAWQRYVFFSHESGATRDSNLNAIPPHFFNWTMSVRPESDIPWPYSFYMQANSRASLSIAEVVKNKEAVMEAIKIKTKLAAWMVSNCYTPGAREAYMAELKQLPQFDNQLDIYGACGNLTCPKFNLTGCYSLIASVYKFYFALENSVCSGYTTEKAYLSLDNYIVPVVLSRRIAEASLPNGSFIAVDDFASPSELATFLGKLDRDDAAYAQFFDWRLDGLIRTDYAPGKGYGLCGLCEKLVAERDKSKVQLTSTEILRKSYPDIELWWYNQSVCDHSAKGFVGKFLKDI